MDVVIGTAGHIDHGKTSLIKALTGKDADRLPEEKARGITIDLGFAEMVIGETRIGFVDVPGHEKFIKNMLAGATGIDAVLFVVAADEGVMPQTREHLEICSLLKIPNGIIVLTKSDAVEDAWAEAVEDEVRVLVAGSFLENAPIVRVSSKTGDGLPSLVEELVRMAALIQKPESGQILRLPIDRSFPVKGFGTVITGTLMSGSLQTGRTLTVFPQNTEVRVRGLQIHGKAVESVSRSQRTAVNLGGVEHKDIHRGNVLTEKSDGHGTQVFDALVEILPSAKKDLKSRQRVRVHHGAAEILARVHILSEHGNVAPESFGWVQIRLESPVLVFPGDRFVIRSYSPQQTIGGGAVVRINSPRVRSRELKPYINLLERLNDADDQENVLLLATLSEAANVSIDKLQTALGWKFSRAKSVIESLLSSENLVGDLDFAVEKSVLSKYGAKFLAFIEDAAEKDRLSQGVAISELRSKFKSIGDSFISLVIDDLISRGVASLDGDLLALQGRSASFTAEEEGAMALILQTLKARALMALKKSELALAIGLETGLFERVFAFLVSSKRIEVVSGEFVFLTETLTSLETAVLDFADKSVNRLIDVSSFKELTGLSRKYAIPLLEYLDLKKITVRSGEKRVVIKRVS
jgi:selenocysteine-specific elongation factor